MKAQNVNWQFNLTVLNIFGLHKRKTNNKYGIIWKRSRKLIGIINRNNML